MNVSPKISIVFVNYRSALYLKSALASLFAFEPVADFFEVIVVNNDADESVLLQALKQEYSFSLIESGGNLGFGRGNNLGVKEARGDILAFINPDILWTGAHLEKIASLFDADQAVGIVGMTLLNEDEEPEMWSAGQAPSLFSLAHNNLLGAGWTHLWRYVWRFGQAPTEDPSSSSLDWVSGGGLCIRKDVFSAIGGFDERFFLYFEDVDLCTEVRLRGFSVVRRTDLPLIHLGGKSSPSTRLQKKHFYASQKQYFDKWRPRWERTVLSWLQFFFCRA